MIKNKRKILITILTVLIPIFLVAGIVLAVTTIGTDITTDGNTTLGDASIDTLTFNASTLAIPNNLNIDSNTFFVDAENNRVGIGTTPGARLSLPDSTYDATAGIRLGDVNIYNLWDSTELIIDDDVYLGEPSTTVTAGNPDLNVEGNIMTNAGYYLTDDDAIGIGFTGPRIIFDSTPSPDEISLMNANVGIGTDGPDEKFEVEWVSGGTDVEIGRGAIDTDITFITLRSANGTKWYIYPTDAGALTVTTTKP